MKISTRNSVNDVEFDTIIVDVTENENLSTKCQDINHIYQQIKSEGLFETREVFGTRVNGLHFENKEYTKLIFVGMPKKSTPRNLKLRYGQAAKEANRLKSKAILYISQVTLDASSIQYVLEGFLLGLYTFDKYLEKQQPVAKIQLTVLTEKKIDQALEKAQNIACAIYTARDLSNEPSNIITPAAFAEAAQKYGKEFNFAVTIFHKQEIKTLKMDAFLAVAKGSDEEPALIVMEYHGAPESREKLAFVGKGVCFDSGGYWLKEKNFMGHMKSDMEGAADVLGTMCAVAKGKLKINIVAVVAACENLISGTAYKPSDIIQTKSGKLIEVVNTDAEGRITLIDAITYAIQEKQATKIVDIATLTGACAMALGNRFIGAFSNDEEFYKQAEISAYKAGENIWRLPISEEYKDYNKSLIAPIKNAGPGMGGAISAAMFIQEFVEDLPWLHFDVAGASCSDVDAEIFSRGATGSGTALLYELANSFSE